MPDNVPFTTDESAVYGELRLYHGRASALPIASIARRTGMKEREIKAAVEGLILRHNILVGSSRGKPCGYYLIETAEDLLKTIRPLKNQAIAELRRVYALLGKDQRRLRELLGQMELEVCK